MIENARRAPFAEKTSVKEFSEETDLSFVKFLHDSWLKRSAKSCMNIFMLFRIYSYLGHTIVWFLTLIGCFVMAIINIRSLAGQIFGESTNTEIELIRNDLFKFPNVTYCFDGLPELINWASNQYWSPYSNENFDGPAWCDDFLKFNMIFCTDLSIFLNFPLCTTR